MKREEQAKRLLAVIDKHACDLTLEAVIDLAAAVGMRLKVQIIENESEPSKK